MAKAQRRVVTDLMVLETLKESRGIVADRWLKGDWKGKALQAGKPVETRCAVAAVIEAGQGIQTMTEKAAAKDPLVRKCCDELYAYAKAHMEGHEDCDPEDCSVKGIDESDHEARIGVVVDFNDTGDKRSVLRMFDHAIKQVSKRIAQDGDKCYDCGPDVKTKIAPRTPKEPLVPAPAPKRSK